MLNYEDLTSCTDLNSWRVRHIKVNIVNIETISQYSNLFRVNYVKVLLNDIELSIMELNNGTD